MGLLRVNDFLLALLEHVTKYGIGERGAQIFNHIVILFFSETTERRVDSLIPRFCPLNILISQCRYTFFFIARVAQRYWKRLRIFVVTTSREGFF